MNGISALKSKALESSLVFHHVRAWQEAAVCKPRSGPSPGWDQASLETVTPLVLTGWMQGVSPVIPLLVAPSPHF